MLHLVMAGKEKENMKIRKGKQRRVLATASSALSGRRRRRRRREVGAPGLLMHVKIVYARCVRWREGTIVYDARWREGTSVYDGERKRVCTRCAYEVYDVYDVYDGDWSR